MEREQQVGAGDPHAADVAARIGEFVDPGAPWHRALWLASSVLSLRELLEHGEQLQAKAIQGDQVGDAAKAADARLKGDVGIGNQAITDALAEILDRPSDLSKEDQRYRLAQLAEEARNGYLERWEAALSRPIGERPKPERASRHLTSHLLDEGVSPKRIEMQVRGALESELTSQSLCSALKALLDEPSKKWRVIVPLLELPLLFRKAGLTASRQLVILRNRSALEQEHPHLWPVELKAGLVLVVKARDPWSAVSEARELLTRLQARLSVSTQPAVLQTHKFVTIDGLPDVFGLQPERQPARVPALERSKKTLRIGGYAEADAIDDALELLAGFSTGTPGAALSSGWAALEALLVSAGEKGVLAAERSADILAAAWPRSELTWLANAPFVEAATDVALHDALRASGSGAVDRKVAALEAALYDGRPVTYERPRDVAALHRIENLLRDPHESLSQVRQGIVEAFRRLYVQRNLVMHAGSFRSVARPTTLRTVPALAAGVMDRLVHAAALGVKPLMLSARARVELSLVEKGGTGRPLHQLLD